MKKTEFFKIEGNKINRIRKHCPKCGPAVFLAEHKNRFSCGKCGYTEFKGSIKKEPQTEKINEKSIEQNAQKIEKPDLPEEKVKTDITEQTVDETNKENQSDEKHFEKQENIKSDDQDSKEDIKDKKSEEPT